MAFDGFVTRAMVTELNKNLLNGRVEKIYHPDRNDLVIFFHSNKLKYRLYISCDPGHPGLYLTDENFQNPLTPSSFCMLLRKHLQNAKVNSISQRHWERIVEIFFETRDELGFSTNKKLVIEIMGKHSNIILVDMTSGKIIDSIKRVSFDNSRVRQIFPGGLYEYPPSQDKISPDNLHHDFFDAITSSKDLLAKVDGLSPSLAEEIFETTDPLLKLQGYMDKLNKGDFDCSVYTDIESKPVDFHVLHMDSYSSMSKISFPTVSNTVKYYYEHRESSNRIKQKSSDLHRHISSLLKKLYLKKQRLLEDLQAAENSEKYRLYGELLTANIHMVEPGSSSVDVNNYYDDSQLTIPLDKRYHPSKNAQMYFKKYSKAKTAIIEKKVQLKNTDEDIYYLESIIGFINRANDIDTIDEIRQELIDSGFLKRRKVNEKAKKKNLIQPHVYMSSGGFRILVGRNNRENDILTMKEASKNDLWFHTKDIPGSHTVLFTDGLEPEQKDILEAASIAAFHSKAQNSENVPVDCTYVRYVKKPNGAKPGMVIFTDNKTLYVNPSTPEITKSTDK